MGILDRGKVARREAKRKMSHGAGCWMKETRPSDDNYRPERAKDKYSKGISGPQILTEKYGDR
jgi:hypothetical protein